MLCDNNKKTLVIEDDKAIRDSLKFVLEFEGYKVFTAANGKEGIDLLLKIPRPCLILLDLMMPVMNGWEFIETMGKNTTLSNIPVIVVSAFTERAKDINAKAIMKKPVDIFELLNIVKEHCGNELLSP